MSASVRSYGAQLAGLRALHVDPVRDFTDAIRDAGIPIDEPERIAPDGAITRFHVEGDHHGSRNGWCVLFQDAHGAGGAFGHWRTGITGSWRSGRGPMSPEERDRQRASIAEARRMHDEQRRRVTDAVAERALEIWSQAPAADLCHPYLMRKHVQPHGIRQLDQRLVIPLRDGDGKLWSVQFIGLDGTKRFLSGGRKHGCYFAIGKIVDRSLCLAEGFATAASVHETTGRAVAVAFDCGNLEPVARVLRAKFPDATITVCADNDTRTPGNPGLTKARIAAAAVNGYVAIPPNGCNDFNDAAAGGGE